MGDTDYQHKDRINEALAGDPDKLAELFAEYRPRLKRMVELRLNGRVRARLDASDVLQEAFVDVSERLSDYASSQTIPFFLWLRMVTGDRLAQIHRKHLGTKKRDANREISLNQAYFAEASGVHLASHLAGQFTSVDRNLIGEEVSKQIEKILNTMDARDREVIAMRHFEELTVEEISTLLDLTPSGVSKRYARAIRKLTNGIHACSSRDRHDE
ncbi:MAG: sigma-70 family RNA polymerase sigma factor [Planctomycetota bacterium]